MLTEGRDDALSHGRQRRQLPDVLRAFNQCLLGDRETE